MQKLSELKSKDYSHEKVALGGSAPPLGLPLYDSAVLPVLGISQCAPSPLGGLVTQGEAIMPKGVVVTSFGSG
jgi:hypothetical protein